MDKANHRGRAYRCKHCQKKGKTEINTKQRLEDHVYKYHVANDEQPFWCRICLFRSRTKEGLLQHVKTFARHRNVMIEKGFVHSRPYLVCTLNPYEVSEKDIELLSKDESMAWWTKKELPSKKGNILERALEEADISFGEESPKRAFEEADISFGGKSPKLSFYVSDFDETKMATENLEKGMTTDGKDEEKFVARRDDEWNFESNVVLDLTVKHAGEFSDRIISIVEDDIVESYPLDLRVVRKRDEPNTDTKLVEDCGTLKDRIVVEAADKMTKEKATVCSSKEVKGEGERKETVYEGQEKARDRSVKEMVKGSGREEKSEGDRKEMATHGNREEGTAIRQEEDNESMQEEESDYDVVRKEERKVDSRKSTTKRRLRHSLKRHRSPSTSSTSSSDSSSSSSSDSSTGERENKFCKIMCEMVQKTGDLIGAQVISNGEMINKLQRTVDELRKEVSDLKKERDAAIKEKEVMIKEQNEERKETHGGSSKSKSKPASEKKEENHRGKENQSEMKGRSEEKSTQHNKQERAFARVDKGYEREGRSSHSYRPPTRHHYGRRSWNFWNKGYHY